MELRPLLDPNGRPVVGSDGEIVMQMDLCPHSEKADKMLTETMQQVQQVQKAIQRESHMQQQVSHLPLPQPDRLYPPPFLVGARNHNHFGELFPHSYMSSPSGSSVRSSFTTSYSSSSNPGRERSGSNNKGRNRHDSHSADSRSHTYGNNRSKHNADVSPRIRPEAVKHYVPNRVVSFDATRPKQAQPVRKMLVHDVGSGGKSPSVLESIATTNKPAEAAQVTYVNNKADSTPLTFVQAVRSGGKSKEAVASIKKTTNPAKAARIEYVHSAASPPHLTLVKNIPSGGVDRASLHATPTTNEPAEAAQVTYVNNRADSTPLTFVQAVRSGGKSKEVVASIKETTNPAKAARIEYGNDGIARTFVKRVNSGGSSSPVHNGSTTHNLSEATSLAYVSSKVDQTTSPSSSTKSNTKLSTPTRSSSLDNSSRISSSPASYVDSNRAIEPNIPHFTTNSIVTGPRNPSPKKPNPNRSLNNGEYISQASRKPVEVPSITIGANLSKAFDKVQEKAKEEDTTSRQTVQNQQREQVATVVGGTHQEKTQKKASKKTEAGESFGTSATNEVVVESANASTAESTKEIQHKSESLQVNTTPAATRTRQIKGTSSNVTEAARITEVETPKGKAKIIEGGRTTGVSANAPQRTTSHTISDEEIVAEVAKGTDEKNEDIQVIQASPAQKQISASTAPVPELVKVKRTGQTAAASLSLSVNNDYLDFTNPHGVGDAFKKAWFQALSA